VIEAQNANKRILQVGSQFVSSIVYRKAKEILSSGAIGKLNLVDSSLWRRGAQSAWQYSIPPDASPRSCDWERFQGRAPKTAWDPKRFFRWRNYRDYGTGIGGDLFVHQFTSAHFVTGSKGPSRVFATGGGIPMHYDMFTFNTESPAEFVDTCKTLNQPHAVLRCGQRWSRR
jgi:predicted dehydrogenase